MLPKRFAIGTTGKIMTAKELLISEINKINRKILKHNIEFVNKNKKFAISIQSNMFLDGVEIWISDYDSCVKVESFCIYLFELCFSDCGKLDIIKNIKTANEICDKYIALNKL